MGRPKKAKSHRRDKILRICLRKYEERLLREAARMVGEDTSVWARGVLLLAAEDLAKEAYGTD